MACWSIVNYINIPSKAFKGNKTNWDCGINNPIIADIKGILNVLFDTGIFWVKIWPFAIWHCGTVGEINGSRTPFENIGDTKFVKPCSDVIFGTFWLINCWLSLPG